MEEPISFIDYRDSEIYIETDSHNITLHQSFCEREDDQQISDQIRSTPCHALAQGGQGGWSPVFHSSWNLNLKA